MTSLPHPLPPPLAELTAGRMRILGVATRVRILDLLRDEERPVAEIAAALGVSQQSASSHLGALLQAGILARRKHGTSAFYRVADPTALALCERVRQGLSSARASVSPLHDCGVDNRRPTP